jgi:hypothetical protein
MQEKFKHKRGLQMKSWFAAHALIAMQRVDLQGPISVYENIFLVEASSHKHAKELAIEMAKPEAECNDQLTVNGMEARCFLVGIRKTILISQPTSSDLDETSPPISGTEITYSEFEVESEEDLKKLATGDCVVVRYVD